MHWNRGQTSGAEEMRINAKEICVRVLAAEHPDTQRSTGNVALTYWNQEHWKETEES